MRRKSTAAISTVPSPAKTEISTCPPQPRTSPPPLSAGRLHPIVPATASHPPVPGTKLPCAQSAAPISPTPAQSNRAAAPSSQLPRSSAFHPPRPVFLLAGCASSPPEIAIPSIARPPAKPAPLSASEHARDNPSAGTSALLDSKPPSEPTAAPTQSQSRIQSAAPNPIDSLVSAPALVAPGKTGLPAPAISRSPPHQQRAQFHSP